MTQTIIRKQSLLDDIRNHHASIRPPWALFENDFVEQYSQCGECIEHCQENILVKDKYNYSIVNLNKDECIL